MNGTCKLFLTPNVELPDSDFTPKSTYGLFHEKSGEVRTSLVIDETFAN
jgi:hypothetical protein